MLGFPPRHIPRHPSASLQSPLAADCIENRMPTIFTPTRREGQGRGTIFITTLAVNNKPSLALEPTTRGALNSPDTSRHE